MTRDQYRWRRPAIDEPGAILLPLQPIIDHVGVPCDVVELGVQLARAAEIVRQAEVGGPRPLPRAKIRPIRRIFLA